ncbi:MAG: IS982 family transposase [Acidobacteriaceae bacterium]|nr:IS982 family transposase [Acidobacteriaceae bacterium]MBV9038054.1 IS982 family transposase [Acidobacteriaceae bacterium]
MSSIEDQLTQLYVFIDDFLTTHPTLSHWRRSPHAVPAFTDAEVLTIALLQGDLGGASLKQTYRLIAQNYRSAFPRLCSYQQWMARLQALTVPIGALLSATMQLPNGSAAFYLIDAKPLPVCHRLRHGRVRLLREEGAYWGKTSKGWFFGFKLHVLRHIEGRIVNLVLTPGNWDDRAPVLALLDRVDGGITLGDLGYRGKQRVEEWAEAADMFVLTRADAPEKKGLLAQVRQAIETSFSQLWYRFLDRVFSRSWRGLWNTVQLKVLHHNLRHAGLLSA